MKFKHLAIFALGSGLAVLGVEPLRAQSAASDSTERSSPLDNNPACMDRDTDSSTGKCVEPSAGAPRHKRPPPAGSLGASPASTSPAAAPSSNPKASSSASGGK